MKFQIIAIIILVLLNDNIFAQKTTYDIFAMDKEIGIATMDKKKVSENNYILDYSFEALVKFLFIKTTVDMKINISYENDQMISADLRYKQNDKLLARNYQYEDSEYTVNTNEKISNFSKKVYVTVMNLYIKEPIGVKEIFLEKQNEFAALKSLGNHQYSVIVDGDECTYTYKNGKLQKVYIDAIVDFIMIRRN